MGISVCNSSQKINLKENTIDKEFEKQRLKDQKYFNKKTLKRENNDKIQ